MDDPPSTGKVRKSRTGAGNRANRRRVPARLNARQSDVEQAKYQRYFKTGEGDYGEGDFFMGVRMGEVFTLAKEFAAMPPRLRSRSSWKRISTRPAPEL